MIQKDEDMQKICSAWLTQVFSGKRAGKEFLFLQNKKLNAENLKLLADYIEQNFHEFVSPENLDRAVRYLSRSGRFAGQKVEALDLDISKPAAKAAKDASGAISLEAGGGIQAILSKFLGGVQKVHERWDAQEVASKKAFVPLPRRELSEVEMRRATKEQLKDWCAWKNNSDVRTGGDLR